jgi:hypothetical protein
MSFYVVLLSNGTMAIDFKEMRWVFCDGLMLSIIIDFYCFDTKLWDLGKLLLTVRLRLSEKQGGGGLMHVILMHVSCTYFLYLIRLHKKTSIYSHHRRHTADHLPKVNSIFVVYVNVKLLPK